MRIWNVICEFMKSGSWRILILYEFGVQWIHRSIVIWKFQLQISFETMRSVNIEMLEFTHLIIFLVGLATMQFLGRFSLRMWNFEAQKLMQNRSANLTKVQDSICRDACKIKIAHILSLRDNSKTAPPPPLVPKSSKISDFFYDPLTHLQEISVKLVIFVLAITKKSLIFGTFETIWFCPPSPPPPPLSRWDKIWAIFFL